MNLHYISSTMTFLRGELKPMMPPVVLVEFTHQYTNPKPQDRRGQRRAVRRGGSFEKLSQGSQHGFKNQLPGSGKF
jgi:hypothetical protein